MYIMYITQCIRKILSHNTNSIAQLTKKSVTFDALPHRVIQLIWYGDNLLSNDQSGDIALHYLHHINI